MLCVAAALALAVVLSLAGVLGGGGGLVLRDKKDTGVVGGGAGGLSLQAGGRAAKNPGECGREGQVVCGIDLHEEAPFLVGPRDFLRRVVVFVRVRGREPLETLALAERGGQQLVSKRKNDPGDKGYKLSLSMNESSESCFHECLLQPLWMRRCGNCRPDRRQGGVIDKAHFAVGPTYPQLIPQAFEIDLDGCLAPLRV